MGITRQHVDGFDFLSGNFKIQHFFGAHLPLLDQAVTGHHNEKFPLGVVPVLPLGHAGTADVHAELTAVRRFQQLREAAPGISVHFQGERRLFPGQVG